MTWKAQNLLSPLTRKPYAGCTHQGPLYDCPGAAVTNYHNPGSLKQKELVSKSWRPEAKISFWGLQVSGLWLHHSSLCLCLHMVFSLVSLCSPFFFFFKINTSWPCTSLACRILVPQPGIEPTPPAVEVHSLHHWTTRDVPLSSYKRYLSVDLGPT